MAVAGLIVGFPGVLFFIFAGMTIVGGFLGIGAAATAVVSDPGLLDRANEERRGEQLASASRSQGSVPGNPVAGSWQEEEEYKRQFTAYESTLAEWDSANEQLAANTSELADTQVILLDLKADEPKPPVFEQREWSTVIGNHTMTGTLVDTDGTNVDLIKSSGDPANGVLKDKLIAEDRVYVDEAFEKLSAYRDVKQKWQTRADEATARQDELKALVAKAESPKPEPPDRNAIAAEFAKRKAEAEAKASRMQEEAEEAQRLAELNKPQLNARNYAKVRPGMTFQEVVAILGQPSSELSSSKFGNIHTVMYEWKSGILDTAHLTFQSKSGEMRLSLKSQFGL